VPTYQFQAENLFLNLLFLRLSLLGKAARDCRLRAAGKAAQPPATLAAASSARRNSYIIPKQCLCFSNLLFAPVLRIQILPDPDLLVRGTDPGSGSGSFYNQAKIKTEKPWFLLFCQFFITFYLWKMM
jgi:hypothetical protein